MGNGVSTDQGNLPSYGIRDVSDAADRKQHDWSQLAEAPIIEQPRIALWSTGHRETLTCTEIDEAGAGARQLPASPKF